MTADDRIYQDLVKAIQEADESGRQKAFLELWQKLLESGEVRRFVNYHGKDHGELKCDELEDIVYNQTFKSSLHYDPAQGHCLSYIRRGWYRFALKEFWAIINKEKELFVELKKKQKKEREVDKLADEEADENEQQSYGKIETTPELIHVTIEESNSRKKALDAIGMDRLKLIAYYKDSLAGAAEAEELDSIEDMPVPVRHQFRQKVLREGLGNLDRFVIPVFVSDPLRRRRAWRRILSQ